MGTIISQTLDLLKSKYAARIAQLAISDVRIGAMMTAVRLSDGSCGIASTVLDDGPNCDKDQRDFGDFSPTRIKGRSVLELFETQKKINVLGTLRIAALNAISSQVLQSGGYRVLDDTDPLDLVDLSSGKTVCVVGAFHSYIKKLAAGDHKLSVLELKEQALLPEHRHLFVPAAEYPRVLPDCDIVIITGYTLVNNTFDGLLQAVSPGARVIVTGPSSSLIPDVLFANGVELIGATRVTDPAALFEVVGEAGSGYHLFRYCARKICIQKLKE